MVHSTSMFASHAVLMTSGRAHPDGKVHMLVPVMPVLGPSRRPQLVNGREAWQPERSHVHRSDSLGTPPLRGHCQ